MNTRRFGSRVWLSGACDAAACALFAVLLIRIFFAVDPSFDGLAVAVGVVGIVGAAASGGLRRTPVDWPLGVYISLAVLSAVVRGHTVPRNPTFSDSHPALHLVLLALYFYSAVWILRTPRRLALLAVFVVGAVSVIGIQTTVDQIAAGVTARMETYPSVPQWSGYPELGLLAVQALPFPAAMLMLSRSRIVIVAAAITAAVLWLNAMGLHSRSADFIVAVTYLLMAGVEAGKLGQRRLLTGALVFAVVAGAIWIRNATWQIAGVSDVVQLRFGIWRNALSMIRDHPWLGVGAGNYAAALRAGYVSTASRFDAHASNMLLHVAAESGIPAAVAFVMIWWKTLAAGYSGGMPRDAVGVVRIGLFVASTVFFVRSMSDHFLAGITTADRMSFFVWTVLAATIAASRCVASPASPASRIYHRRFRVFGPHSALADA